MGGHEIYTAKGKRFTSMSEEEKRAFVESVCLRAMEMVTTESSNKNFFRYWGSVVLKAPMSVSQYMKRYFYDVRDNVTTLCLMDDEGSLIDISKNTKEVKLFVFNAINEVPFHSPIIQELNSGKKKFELISDGVDTMKYGSLTDVKASRPRKDSLRQKILRGEITRYEAYEKPKRERKTE